MPDHSYPRQIQCTYCYFMFVLNSTNLLQMRWAAVPDNQAITCTGRSTRYPGTGISDSSEAQDRIS
eukprot:329848-Rhodomonas_salina.2